MNDVKCEKCKDTGIYEQVGFGAPCMQCLCGNAVLLLHAKEHGEMWDRLARQANPEAFQPNPSPVEQAGWPRYFDFGEDTTLRFDNERAGYFWIPDEIKWSPYPGSFNYAKEKYKQIPAAVALTRIDDAKKKAQPSEPFQREEGYIYNIQDWREGDQHWENGRWISCQQYGHERCVHPCRRKLLSPQSVTAEEKSLGQICYESEPTLEGKRWVSLHSDYVKEWENRALAVIAAWKEKQGTFEQVLQQCYPNTHFNTGVLDCMRKIYNAALTPKL